MDEGELDERGLTTVGSKNVSSSEEDDMLIGEKMMTSTFADSHLPSTVEKWKRLLVFLTDKYVLFLWKHLHPSP